MKAKAVSSKVMLGLIYKGKDIDQVTFQISPPVLGSKKEFGATYKEEVSVLLQKGTDKVAEASILQYAYGECIDGRSLLRGSPIENAEDFLKEAVKKRDEKALSMEEEMER